MTILFLTIPVTLLLVSLFVVLFLSAVRTGQFEDLDTPPHAVLLEGDKNTNEEKI